MSNGPAVTRDQSNSGSSSKKSSPTFHFLAGLTSGVSSAVLLQPADLLKTRVQQSRTTSLLPTLRGILAGPNPVASLWRGTVPSALRTGFGSALYFSSLSTLRQFVANNAVKSSRADDILANNTHVQRSSSVLPRLSPAANLLTGATARVFAGFVLMPFTVIKVRYESDFYAYRSIASAAGNIFRMEGFRGFFTGLGATTVRDAPYAGLYVVIYEASKARLSRIPSTDSDEGGATSTTRSATINATSGIIAATSATAMTNPFDAVKTRLQLMPTKYTNMLQAIKLMFREEGMRSFFDGLGLRMARKAASSALAWTVYEELVGRAERRFAAKTRDEIASAAV